MNVFTTFLDCEVESENKVMLKVLEAKGIHGRAKGIERLIQHMAETDNPFVDDTQATALSSTKWIDECIILRRGENV